MEANELTANSPIHLFSDEQIKKAMKIIEGDSPIYYFLGLLDTMISYIANHKAIDDDIKREYFVMSVQLQFYLTLLKTTIGYKG